MKWSAKQIIYSFAFFMCGTMLIIFRKDYIFVTDNSYIYITINLSSIVFRTDEKFLSFALDTSFMKCLFHELNDSDWEKLKELSTLLSPAYLRIGGTAADQVVFYLNQNRSNSKKEKKYLKNIALEDQQIVITGEDWVKINDFAIKSNLSFLFDLNVLLRNGTRWNSTNAQALLEFSENNGFNLDFQLGNEPNSFKHVFNISISGSQLAEDFNTLKQLLKSSSLYKSSKLIGPDVTRPKNVETSSLDYLKEFLSKTNSVDIASWHQYYVNGKTAVLKDFIDPQILDILPHQINEVLKVVREFSKKLPVWISETSSAYGSGSPGLSDRFVAIFMWLDKLGVSAKSGMKVVIRQSLFKGHYALIDDNFSPSPDFWISYFFKKLIGNRVLNVTHDKDENIRFYSHCSNSMFKELGKVAVFGMNLSNETKKVIISGMVIKYPIYSYVFTSENGNLTSKSIYLNGKKLVYENNSIHGILKQPNKDSFPLALPSYSAVIWLFHVLHESICD